MTEKSLHPYSIEPNRVDRKIGIKIYGDAATAKRRALEYALMGNNQYMQFGKQYYPIHPVYGIMAVQNEPWRDKVKYGSIIFLSIFTVTYILFAPIEKKENVFSPIRRWFKTQTENLVTSTNDTKNK